MPLNIERDLIARELARIAIEAGDVIRSVIKSGLTSTTKADGSECSNADVAAQDIVLEHLHKRFPGIDVIAEEQTHAVNSPDRSDTFFLVDPLDGTRNFLTGGHEYGVNIALIDQRRPLAGAIHAPAFGRTWFGGGTAMMSPQRDHWIDHISRIYVRDVPQEGVTALVSHRRGDPQSTQFLNLFSIAHTRPLSSSIKFGVIAEGRADLYVRYGPTMEWDTASGHAILNAAGGYLTQVTGKEKYYGHASRGYHNEAFVAWGSKQLARIVMHK